MRIHLYNNQLLGPLPKFFGRFPKLEYLHLGSNRLTGKIPDSLAALTSLRFLDVANNAFVGDVPDFFANMPLLKKLDISNNNFNAHSLSKTNQDLTATKGTKVQFTRFDGAFSNHGGQKRAPQKLST